MRPVTQNFLDAIRGSHRISSRARLVSQFQSTVDPEGEELLIISGDVNAEATIFGDKEVKGVITHSSLDLTIEGTGLFPRIHGTVSQLTPFGNEIYVERGIAFGNGSTEWVGLGYFRIDKEDQDDTPDGPIRLSCSDRFGTIIDSRFPQPRQYQSTELIGDVVDDMILEIYPAAIIEWDDATNLQQLGRMVIIEKERIEGFTDLVTSLGKMAFWDHRGVLVIRDVPDASIPVFQVNAGEDGVLVNMRRSLTRDEVYNGVVASGEAADTNVPVLAVVVDSSATPTRWGGPFGKIPRFYSSPFITTELQAESAGKAILQQSTGIPYQVDFSMVPNVALEPLDTVAIDYPNRARGKSLHSENHILTKLTYPLAEDQAMTAITREQLIPSVTFL